MDIFHHFQIQQHSIFNIFASLTYASVITSPSCGMDMNLWWLEGRLWPTQRCPHPNPQNLWICYLMWPKGLQMGLSEGSWDGESILDYPGGPRVIIKVLPSERGKVESRYQRDTIWERPPPPLSWRWKGTISQAMGAASRNYTRQWSSFFPKASGKNVALLTPWS